MSNVLVTFTNYFVLGLVVPMKLSDAQDVFVYPVNAPYEIIVTTYLLILGSQRR